MAYDQGPALTNHPQVGRGAVGGWGLLLLGVPFVAAGGGITLLGLEVIHVDSASVHVPMWVLAVCGLIFLLPGVWIMLRSAYGLWSQAAWQRAAARHPDEPWRADYPWNEQGGRDHNSGPLSAFVGAAMMTLFLVPFHAVFAQERGFEVYFLGCFMLFFDLILLLVWGNAFHKLLRRLKYGRARVVFDRFPYAPGAPLVVTFYAPPALKGYEHLDCTLRCVVERMEVTGSGENRSNSLVCREVYADARQVPAGEVAGAEIRLAFELPADAPSSTLSASAARYWELEVKAETPGVDYAGLFLLPVY